MSVAEVGPGAGGRRPRDRRSSAHRGVAGSIHSRRPLRRWWYTASKRQRTGVVSTMAAATVIVALQVSQLVAPFWWTNLNQAHLSPSTGAAPQSAAPGTLDQQALWGLITGQPGAAPASAAPSSQSPVPTAAAASARPGQPTGVRAGTFRSLPSPAGAQGRVAAATAAAVVPRQAPMTAVPLVALTPAGGATPVPAGGAPLVALTPAGGATPVAAVAPARSVSAPVGAPVTLTPASPSIPSATVPVQPVSALPTPPAVGAIVTRALVNSGAARLLCTNAQGQAARLGLQGVCPAASSATGAGLHSARSGPSNPRAAPSTGTSSSLPQAGTGTGTAGHAAGTAAVHSPALGGSGSTGP